MTPVCPAARSFEGATPGDGGVVCTVMERDQARADSILEGSPIGVELRWRTDPSTLAAFCYGEGPPSSSEDPSQHYTACPIWCAGKDIDLVERAFSAPEARNPEVPGLELDPEAMTFHEKPWSA
jgi:hypothetical protein